MYHKTVLVPSTAAASMRSTCHSITIDTNNNAPAASGFLNFKAEKYSLRQRCKRPIIEADDPEPPTTNSRSSAHKKPRRNNAKAKSTTPANAFLNPAISPDDPPPSAAKPKKPKPKSAPLSKYRRKTANARERTRMREINSAFENLRKFVPLSFGGDSPASTNEKLTKITTLRLAMKYIQSLNEVLHTGSADTSSGASVADDHHAAIEDALSVRSDGASDSDASSDSNSRHSSGSSPVNETPRSDYADLDLHAAADLGYGLQLNEESKDLFKDLLMTAYGSADTHRLGKLSRQSSAKDRRFGDETTVADDSSAIMFNAHESCVSASSLLHDIGLMFESDGESLQLSESCLSPTSSSSYSLGSTASPAMPMAPMGQHLLATNATMHQTPLLNDFSAFPSSTSALELGALLAESDSDALELSEHCPLSPLAGLDVLGPFGDLIMSGTDFAEPQHLEMYLS